MDNRDLRIQGENKNRQIITLKLALKTRKKDFSPAIISNIANLMKVELTIVGKLRGIDLDQWDWYFVEVKGKSGDLIPTLLCWNDLGIENIFGI